MECFLRLFKVWRRFISGLNVFGAAWIVFLMLLTLSDIIGRSVFYHPVPGAPEMGKLTLVIIVFLQLPYVFDQGRNIAADFLSPRLNQIWRFNLQVFIYISGIILFVFISVSSWSLALTSLVYHEFEYAAGYHLPVAPIRVIVFTGSVFVVIELALCLIQQLLTNNPVTPKNKRQSKQELSQ